MHSSDINSHETHHFLPINIINGIKFTPREIDTIACLLGRRTAKKIASFLYISPKTVENHIRNIMQKLECNSRESIIDFVENSDEASILKKYYSTLLWQATFEERLREASGLIGKKGLLCNIVYWPEVKHHTALVHMLGKDLKRVGVNVTIQARSKLVRLESLNKDMEHSENFTLYALPKALKQELQAASGVAKIVENAAKNPNNILFLIFESESKRKDFKSFSIRKNMGSEEQRDYYYSFFEMLISLFPNLQLGEIFVKLRRQIEGTSDLCETKPLHMKSIRKEIKITKDFFISKTETFLNVKGWKFVGPFIIFLFVFISVGFILFKTNPKTYKNHQASHEAFISSDLIIPAKSVFLDRPEIMIKIDDKLRGQGDIQTIALVGPGGAGKTTTARQYARQQKANVIWEINAESKGNIRGSFENLAQALSKTEEDKKLLKKLEAIKNPKERGEKIIIFVQERLKAHSNWLLIYDNVESIMDIQKYFPHDVNAWGQGKIILTTRNSNVQNKHINHIIQIGELEPKEKLNLFIKIMNDGNSPSSTSAYTNETKKFLEEIPPFPLDVSIAAYYLKVTKVSYQKYVDYIKEYNKKFEDIQKNVLQEAGDYTKTRYGIVSLTLQNIINIDKDFGDLLLFISLLNSRNIPRDLLTTYKKDIIVDDFIYHLKKYSLIIHESFSSLNSTFSIHKNTQAIALSYFVKTFNVSKDYLPLYQMSDALEMYVVDAIDKENFSKMKFLNTHCKAFLSHSNVISAPINGAIASKLGVIANYLGEHEKARNILEESLIALNKNPKKYPTKIAWSLANLGNVYRELGNYEKAKILLEQSLIIYKQFPEKYAGNARALTYLGTVYRELGDYNIAKDLFEQSTAICKNHLPQNYTDMVWTLANLGDAYRELGNYKKAKALMEESLIICKQQFPQDHIETAWVLSRLGCLYRNLGEYQQAKKLLEQSIAISKQQLPENHVRIARILKTLGNVYRQLGDYEKAKMLLEQSLIIFKKNYPKNHIYLAWAYANLASTYRDSGNLEGAKDFFQRSIIIYMQHFGKEHMKTARLFMGIGKTYLLEGDVKNAENLLTYALELFEKNKHPAKYMALEALANLYLKKSVDAAHKGDKQLSQNFKDQAQKYLKEALEIVKTHFPDNSPHIIRIQHKIRYI